MFAGHGWKPVTLRDEPAPLAPELDPGVVMVTVDNIGEREHVDAVNRFMYELRLREIRAERGA